MCSTRTAIFSTRCNLAMVDLEPVVRGRDRDDREPIHQTGDLEGHGRVDVMGDMTRFDAERLRQLITNHLRYTGSTRAREILDEWESYKPKFRKVMPVEYRRALTELIAKRHSLPEARRPRGNRRVPLRNGLRRSAILTLRANWARFAYVACAMVQKRISGRGAPNRANARERVGGNKMGKVTGFLEIDRQDRKYKPAADRIRHYEEFVIPLSEEATRNQAARCMNCGIPFCHNGCPVNNQIPDWNDLVYSGRLAARARQSALDQ